MRTPSPLAPTLLLPFAAACGGETVQSRTDLTQALDSLIVEVQGVTVEPETGRRFILDTRRGIFLEKDGAFSLYAPIDALRAEGHVPISEFNDFAAVGDDQFALIAKNDGFLFDNVLGSFERFFCYVPGDIVIEPDEPGPAPEPRPDPIDPGEDYYQIARNLAYDPANERLVAQPQTFAEDDDALLSAHVGTFARFDGTEQAWFELPSSAVEAGGLSIDDEGRAVLGWGTALWRYDLSARTFEEVADLTGLVIQIDGLSFDPITGTALIVDNQAKELIEIELDL